jgi:hypothetical protein
MQLDINRYFIGFCEHKKDPNNQSMTVSTPKYGILFSNSGLEETFYIGMVNEKG